MWTTHSGWFEGFPLARQTRRLGHAPRGGTWVTPLCAPSVPRMGYLSSEQMNGEWIVHCPYGSC